MYENFEHEILTVEGLMELLYIGKNTAYQLLKSGEIRAFRRGKAHGTVMWQNEENIPSYVS